MQKERGDKMRKKIIAGNWKMNKNPEETKEYFKVFNDLVKDCENEVIICTPFIDLFTAKEATGVNVAIGAQNMHFEDKGAFTGEVSGKMLKDIDIKYVIIGHSERREYFNETDESVNKKIKAALNHELVPILCVGETLEEREAEKAKAKVVSQVVKDFAEIEAADAEKVIIAYEPIWAIGTGKTASSEDANEACKWIRDEIRNLYGEEVAENIEILYGGSVKSSNSKELFEMSDIDGGLVGGASLQPEEFAKIANYNK